MNNRQAFIERAKQIVALSEKADLPDVKIRLQRAAERWRALAETFEAGNEPAQNQPNNER